MRLSEAESQLLGDAYFLDQSQPLYHFLKIKYFEVMVEKRALRLARLDCFKDDPDEGRLSDSNAMQTSHLGAQLSQQLGVNAETEGWKQFINGTQRELTFIHCWFGNEVEDEEMWEHYGDQGRGVCLKTTVRRFQASFDLWKPFYPQIHKVPYLPEDVPIPTIISSLACIRKRPKFAKEREHRLVIQLGFEECPKDPEGRLMPPDHLMLPINLDCLLEAVIVGPHADVNTFLEVEQAINKSGLSRLVRKSALP
jgi:hypothetical protein